MLKMSLTLNVAHKEIGLKLTMKPFPYWLDCREPEGAVEAGRRKVDSETRIRGERIGAG